MAVHRISQKNLPILVVAAGLPQVAGLSGDAKSYAERLFAFRTIGALDRSAVIKAIRNPIERQGFEIDDGALEEIIAKTGGYPFFLQEWGYHAWNVATKSPITRQDAVRASDQALARLDDGFFKVRMDRLTPAEARYVNAMAGLGHGPCRSTEVASVLGKEASALGPCRANIIRKGMIYSPGHGEVDFTVPLFDDFLRRGSSAT